jgi:chromate transporter
VKGIMSGLKPAVVGLIGSAVITVALAVFRPNGSMLSPQSAALWAIVVAVLFWVCQKFKKLHPIVIICICAAIGVITGYLGL